MLHPYTHALLFPEHGRQGTGIVVRRQESGLVLPLATGTTVEKSHNHSESQFPLNVK